MHPRLVALALTLCVLVSTAHTQTLTLRETDDVVGRGIVQITGVEAGAFVPDWWENNTLNWVRDERWPLLQPRPGNKRNIYAPSSVEIPGKGFRIFYGGWDGEDLGKDNIYSTTTKDFLEFGDRQAVINHGDFYHICNVNGIRFHNGSYRLMCTGLPADSNRNKPVVFASTDGKTWNNTQPPYPAKPQDTITMEGYTDYTNADINGMNVQLYEDGKYYIYFGDFRNFGQVHRAVSPDGTHFTYEKPVLDAERAVNDVKKFIVGDQPYYLMGLHMNGPRLYYALSTDGSSFPATHILFTHNGPEDRYIVAIGWVTVGDQDKPGRKIIGTLYGAGAIWALDHNRIFARWLQKKLVFQSDDGLTITGSSAIGPDRQLLSLGGSSQTGTLHLYAEDGITHLASTRVELEPETAYQLNFNPE
ncbi:hypothetical protein [Mucisphaera calidilacus]|uniref:Uncharacterized protein n=1 Tax=Mucisphaera calidilacus TaxID=2527982 RepID=A0A518BZ66_9BACT|nr:hypothetical protein [Mucisphaera calidilacus]QDU72263.1 hypothetical protein Pan265_21270 [Mucisphaera calidilacus]